MIIYEVTNHKPIDLSFISCGPYVVITYKSNVPTCYIKTRPLNVTHVYIEYSEADMTIQLVKDEIWSSCNILWDKWGGEFTYNYDI